MRSSNGETGVTRWKVRGTRAEDSPSSQKRETEREAAPRREKAPRRSPLELNCWTKENGLQPDELLRGRERERRRYGEEREMWRRV